MWQTVCTPKRGCPGCDSAPWSDLSCLSAARQSLKGQKENRLESWECFEKHNPVSGSSNFISSLAKWVRNKFTGNNHQILSCCCGICENLSDFRGRKILDRTWNFIILFPGWILNKPNAHPLIFFLPLSSTLSLPACAVQHGTQANIYQTTITAAKSSLRPSSKTSVQAEVYMLQKQYQHICRHWLESAC